MQNICIHKLLTVDWEDSYVGWPDQRQEGQLVMGLQIVRALLALAEH